MSDQKSSLSAPAPRPQDVQQVYAQAKHELEEVFVKFHKDVLQSKVLEENKSAATKKTEQAIIEQLIKAAVALDQINVGEGLLSLATIAIREQLYVRDRVNQLEYELCKAQRDILNLKKSAGIEDGQQKK